MNIYNPAPQAPDYDVLAARMDMLDGSATAPVIEAYSEIIEQALSEAPVPLNAESAEANGNYYGYLALIDRVSSLALGHTVDDLLARRRSVVPASQYGVDLPLSLLQQISAPEPSNDPTIRSWQERRQAGQEQLRRRVQEQHVDGHLPHLSTLVAQASF